MWNDQQRIDKIKGCLLATYARYMMKLPTNIAYHVKVWSKDLSPIPTEGLQDAFNKAYRNYEPKSSQSRMFNSKFCLEIWDASSSGTVENQKVGCNACERLGITGYIEVYNTNDVLLKNKFHPSMLMLCACNKQT